LYRGRKIRQSGASPDALAHPVIHMPIPIVLASGSVIRAQMLMQAGVEFQVRVPHVDEDALKTAMLRQGTRPREIAGALAQMKADKVSRKWPGAMVIGCDQVLDFQGALISKPDSPEHALDQLQKMCGKTHSLYSAAVICKNGVPLWRHVGQVSLRMRDASDAYLAGYVTRNWDSIRHVVGAYRLEAEGVRLFGAIDGDYFNVLGMPLLAVLNYLTTRKVIEP
jgi:nucleoside triphosphate pyrophosphatase